MKYRLIASCTATLLLLGALVACDDSDTDTSFATPSPLDSVSESISESGTESMTENLSDGNDTESDSLSDTESETTTEIESDSTSEFETETDLNTGDGDADVFDSAYEPNLRLIDSVARWTEIKADAQNTDPLLYEKLNAIDASFFSQHCLAVFETPRASGSTCYETNIASESGKTVIRVRAYYPHGEPITKDLRHCVLTVTLPKGVQAPNLILEAGGKTYPAILPDESETSTSASPVEPHTGSKNF